MGDRHGLWGTGIGCGGLVWSMGGYGGLAWAMRDLNCLWRTMGEYGGLAWAIADRHTRPALAIGDRHLLCGTGVGYRIGMRYGDWHGLLGIGVGYM
jgi:hypothetical protein